MPGRRRQSIFLACTIAAVVAWACGHSAVGGGATTATTSTTLTTTTAPAATAGATTPTTSGCAYPADTIELASSMIRLQAAGSAVSTDLTGTGAVGLDCRNVTATGVGAATMVFGKVAACLFQQADGASAATLRPRMAPYLLQAANAKLTCTFSGVSTSIELCGAGTLSPTGVTQVAVACSNDPSFSVTVYAGNMIVSDPLTKGALVVRGQTLGYSSATPTSIPTTTSAAISCPTCPPTTAAGPTVPPPPSTVPQTLVPIFATQARELGVANASAG